MIPPSSFLAQTLSWDWMWIETSSNAGCDDEQLWGLGSVDISSHPDESTDEMEESEVPVSQLVEPGEEATEMLDLADEAFNEVAFPVQM